MKMDVDVINNQSSDQIILVCAADDNYAMPLAVTCRSVLENLGKDRIISIFIIGNGISKNNKVRIEKSLNSNSCNLRWLDIQIEELQKLSSLPTHSLTIATYYRLFIAEILPDNIKKAIYLDSDLIVRKDTGLLWDLEIGENALMAVQDFGIPFVSSEYGLDQYQELGLAPDCKYFNAGILVINLDVWRTKQVSKKVIEYLLQNQSHIHFADQEELNAILAKKWLELDPRWNQQASLFGYHSWRETTFSETKYSQLLIDPYIVHFSRKKPWKSLDPHPNRHLFFKYLDKTDWKGYRFSILQRLWRKTIRGLKKVFKT